MHIKFKIMKNLNIILIIIIWYIVDTNYLFSGIPILLIPIQKVSFLKEKVLKMVNFSWPWNHTTLLQEQDCVETKSKLTTSVYALGYLPERAVENMNIREDVDYFTSNRKALDKSFGKILSQKIIINASGERVLEQWTWPGKRIPFAIQHSSVIIPFYVNGSVEIKRELFEEKIPVRTLERALNPGKAA